MEVCNTLNKNYHLPTGQSKLQDGKSQKLTMILAYMNADVIQVIRCAVGKIIYRNLVGRIWAVTGMMWQCQGLYKA